MNILHVTPYYAPAWQYGGVVRAVTDQTRALAAAGHTVVVLATDAAGNSAHGCGSEEQLDGVSVIHLRNLSHFIRGRFHLSTPAGFAACLRRILAEQDADLVHCHELRTVENLLVAKALGGGTVPMIVSPHGTASVGFGRRRSKQLWDSVFGKFLLPRIDQVIALTETEAEEVRALWKNRGVPLRPDQVTVVPNGIFAEDAAPPNARGLFRSRWGLGGGPVVVFLGRLAERKGLQLLLPAFAAAAQNIPDARLLIVGPDEGMLVRLSRQAKELSIADHLVFTGMLAGEEKTAALAASDIFALPAVGEGFSMAVLEAMASGLPVLLSPDCNFPEAAQAGAGLEAPRQVGALGEALRNLLQNPERRTAMGRQASALVHARYLWPQVIPQLEAVYRKVARNRGDGAREADHGA
jgi:glycosyltransferase involved in cell wall biosynthesis